MVEKTRKKLDRYTGSKSQGRRNRMKIPMWFLVLPFLLGAGIAPILVKSKTMKLYEKALEVWPSNKGVVIDFFSWKKAVCIILAGAIALILYALKKKGEGIADISYKKYIIPVIIYALFVILSTIFSEFPKTSLNGFVDRYEGMPVLLSYMMLFTAAMYSLDSDKRIRTVLWCISFSTFVVLIIGTLQFFDFDIFRTNFGKSLILNRKLMQYRDNLNFKFPKGRIYTTLYNPNYVGSYSALLLPVFLTLFFSEKKLVLKFSAFAGVILTVINLFGSKSSAGLVGLMAALAFLALIWFVSTFRNNNKIIIAGLSLGVIAVISFAVVNLFNIGGLSIRDDFIVTSVKDEPWYINDMNIMPNKITLDMNQGFLEIHNNKNLITFWDDKEKQIKAYQKNPPYYILDDERYKNMKFAIDRKNKVIVIYERPGKSFAVFLAEEGFYDSVSFLGNQAPLQKPTAWFKGYEQIGSTRGYIWSRSLPLIFEDSLLLGTGPDTYAYVFPQNDIAGKLNGGFKSNRTLVDKPHSMYLQAGINTGFVSLLAIIALFSIYIISTLITYWKIDLKDSFNIIGVGLAAGCVGYMIAGFFNDSTVSVSSMFWVILGCSVAANTLVIKYKQKSAA